MKYLPLNDALYQYLLKISLREHPVLTKLRETTAMLPLAVMQIAPEQGQFLQFLLQLIRADKVLELGTFTGYSALAMALSLPENGRLITCDINPVWTEIAKPFWEEAGMSHKIELRLGPALDSLQQLLEAQQQFDFIFIDADKDHYLDYYELALKLISPKGIIAIDNIFWSAKVLDENDQSAQTRGIRRLNNVIAEDKRVDISLLTLADGLFLIRPKRDF